MKGVVTGFNEERGFGFIRVDEEFPDVFLHITDIPDKRPPSKGQRVSFEVTHTKKGPKAQNVEVRSKQRSPKLTYSLYCLILAALIGGALSLGLGLHWFLSWVAGINLVAFAAYGSDKFLAHNELFRIPEATLHTVTFAGGTPGAFAGQRLFHHKTSTRKRRFRAFYWIAIVLHVAAVVLYVVYL